MTIRKSLKACLILSLALMVVFTMSTAAFAGTEVGQTKISMTKAFNIALEDAGLKKSEVKNVEKDYDDGKYEIEFRKVGTKRDYDYEISKTGKILEKSVDYNRARNTEKKKLTKEDAINKVVDFSGFKKSTVKNGTVTLEKDDGQWVYEVRFDTKSYHYEYDVHGRTGKILEYSKESI